MLRTNWIEARPPTSRKFLGVTERGVTLSPDLFMQQGRFRRYDTVFQRCRQRREIIHEPNDAGFNLKASAPLPIRNLFFTAFLPKDRSHLSA